MKNTDAAFMVQTFYSLTLFILLLISAVGFADPLAELKTKLSERGLNSETVDEILERLPDFNELVHLEEELKTVFLEIYQSSVPLMEVDTELLFRMSGLLYRVNLEKEIFWTGLVFELAKIQKDKTATLRPGQKTKWIKLEKNYKEFVKATLLGKSEEVHFFDVNPQDKKEYDFRRDRAQHVMNGFNSKHRAVFFAARDFFASFSRKKGFVDGLRGLVHSTQERVWEAGVFVSILFNGHFMSSIGQRRLDKSKREGVIFDLVIDPTEVSIDENERQVIFSRHGTGDESAILAKLVMDLVRPTGRSALLFSPFRFVKSVTSVKKLGWLIAKAMERHHFTISVHKELSDYANGKPSPSIKTQMLEALEYGATTLVGFPEGRLAPIFGSITSMGPGSFKLPGFFAAFSKGKKIVIRIVAPVLPNAGYGFATREGVFPVRMAEIDSDAFLKIARGNPSHAASLMEFVLASTDFADSSERLFGSPSPQVILENVLEEFTPRIRGSSCQGSF